IRYQREHEVEECSSLTSSTDLQCVGSNYVWDHDNVRKRLCLGCGGELAMAFNPSENARATPGASNPGRATSKWRCSTCGQVFTADQLRQGRHADANVVEHT
ncbi:MAG: hypothetical protein WB536_17950, partial [Terriglobales bacterium]